MQDKKVNLLSTSNFTSQDYKYFSPINLPLKMFFGSTRHAQIRQSEQLFFTRIRSGWSQTTQLRIVPLSFLALDPFKSESIEQWLQWISCSLLRDINIWFRIVNIQIKRQRRKEIEKRAKENNCQEIYGSRSLPTPQCLLSSLSPSLDHRRESVKYQLS